MSWSADTMVFGNIFWNHAVHIEGLKSLYDFNRWIGWNAPFQMPVTWNDWIGLLILQYLPNRALGFFLFVIPFWIKFFLLAAMFWTVLKSAFSRRRRKQTDEPRIQKRQNRRGDRTSSVDRS
ncbi:hypothetical protein [Alicyclobacillus dauci]|uniref:Uncharacterized protein n=1 Tax=Alicyclobacillus dauci TaxID=1475485 RepID=A0ABY6YZ67_9BACL|nr:hypothetical protein [Alicyclobacillus dauci]WAH35922.1 hypothetical protein NZD86_16855 [Alicyclobacillus dauci]